jgi:hypothetical protein
MGLYLFSYLWVNAAAVGDNVTMRLAHAVRLDHVRTRLSH